MKMAQRYDVSLKSLFQREGVLGLSERAVRIPTGESAARQDRVSVCLELERGGFALGFRVSPERQQNARPTTPPVAPDVAPETGDREGEGGES